MIRGRHVLPRKRPRDLLATAVLALIGLFFAAPASSQTLSCGQSLSDSIGSVGEQGRYGLLGVNVGDTVTIRMVTTSGSLSPFLELQDGGGQQIATGVGTLTHRLEASGPYLIVARDISNSRRGIYRLSLQRVNNPCGATTLACGQNLADVVSFLAEIDTYLLQGVGQGDTVTLRMVTTSGSLAPFIELFNGDGIEIATGVGTLTRRLESAGPYTVLARDISNGRIGNYRLFLQRLNNPCAPAPIGCGQNLPDSISFLAEIDTYILQAVGQGDTVTLRMMATSGSLSPFMELFDGAGTQIATGVGTLTDRPASAGPYTVLARDVSNARLGSYRLFVQRVNNPCSPTALGCGQNLSDSISFTAEIDTYLLRE